MKLFKKLMVIGLLSIASTGAYANDTAVSVELLGRAGVWSLNLDHLVMDNLAVGAGFSTLSGTSGLVEITLTVIPIYANYYFSTDTRWFATGGVDIITGTGSITGTTGALTSSGTVPVIGLGYEYRNGFVFRIAPYMILGTTSQFTGGLSLGFAF